MAIKYKIIKHPSGDSSRDEIEKIGMCTIPRDLGNLDYQQFLQDVKENGNDIVEGPDVLVKEDYAIARRSAYGSIEDQLDKIYHKGLDAWKSDILAIKDAIPKTQELTISVGSIPDWVQSEADAYSP